MIGKTRENVIGILKKYTMHGNVFLTQRGNKAILTALRILKKTNLKTLLIPDQGGWITYSQYAKKLKLDFKKIETGYGIIELKKLEENLKNASALLYPNPAGYYAEQPVKEIYDLCRKHDVFVILDISGCIGSDFYKGNYADIAVCSFGRWKPINLGYGGFISVKSKVISDDNKDLLEALEFDEKYLDNLHDKLRDLKKRYPLFEKNVNKIKKDLENFDILQKDKKGINVVIRFSNEEEKKEIIGYCEKNKYQFVVCPKPIRVKENAISIEVKRLE